MLSILCLLAIASIAAATLPPPSFRFAVASGSNSILAASPKQAMIWGFVPKTATLVDITFQGKTTSATIAPDQANGELTTFRTLLPATSGSFQKYNITATCTSGCPANTEPISATSLMFGEVWICSGQSNMGYPLGTPTCWNASNTNCLTKDAQCSYGCVENAGEEIAAMSNYDGGMRLLKIPKTSSKIPLADVTPETSTSWLHPS